MLLAALTVQLLWLCLCVCVLSHFSYVQFCATLWTVVYKDPLSMGFSRQEYWSGLPCPPPGDLPSPGIKPVPLTSPALAVAFLTTRTTWEAPGSAQVTAKPTLPIFHNDLRVGVPIGQSQGVPMHIILRPNEAALSPFYCLEN